MDPSPVNPKILFTVAAVAAVVFSAIAILVAAGYTPETRSDDAPSVTETSAVP